MLPSCFVSQFIIVFFFWSVGPVPPVMDDEQNGMYAVPRGNEGILPAAPSTPPPPVPLHRNRSPGPSALGTPQAVYEEVELKPTSRQTSPARSTAAMYEEVQPRTVSSSIAPHPDFGMAGEYAEPDTGIKATHSPAVSPHLSRKVNWLLEKQASEEKILKAPAVVPYAVHVEEKNEASQALKSLPSPSSDDDPDAVYSYSQLRKSLVPNEKDEEKKGHRRLASDQYDHTIREEASAQAHVHIDLPGYDRIQHQRLSLTGLPEDQALVAAATASAAASSALCPPDSDRSEQEAPRPVNSRDPYSEVQLRPVSTHALRSSRPGSRHLSHQDSDTSVGPPVEPYQGTPLLSSEDLAEVPERQLIEDEYSSVDDPLIEMKNEHDIDDLYSSVEEPSAEPEKSLAVSLPVGGFRNGLQRRSRSLDDMVESVFEEAAEKERDDLKQQKKRRIEQHPYEEIEVKAKPKPVPAKRFGTQSTSAADLGNPEEERKAAEKWKAEAEKMRQKRLERHNYDMIEPMAMRPRVNSFEAPPAVSLEKVNRSVKVPAPIPVASFHTGEELAWDDSDLEQLASPPSSSATQNSIPKVSDP